MGHHDELVKDPDAKLNQASGDRADNAEPQGYDVYPLYAAYRSDCALERGVSLSSMPCL